jgi:predicted nucleotidyltransferase component of viral defense system
VALTARQSIELFHLVFLRAVVARGEDRGLFALKGGCNLRFFFASLRYSEDIDFDVAVVAKGTLRNKVDRLLASPAVRAPLRARGIEIVDVSAPKQTEVTQRWKLGLRVPGHPQLRTKVEFSRRDRVDGTAFEAVRAEVLEPYAIPPFLATHYAVATAIAQKVEALAGRSEPQARDVFDLSLLFAALDAARVAPPRVPEKRRAVAVERARGVSFDEYVSQVVAFLDPGQREVFEGRDTWNAMQDAVVRRLEALDERE